ncbi:MAG: hypothetical protein JWL77_1547 [Chthonomonadaceae bacterium]|nr:hypothetical protein [Chthonomonadaceae bacterium]
MSRITCRRYLTWTLTFLLGTLALSAGAQDKTLIVRPIADAPSFVKRALVIGIGQYEHAGSLAPTTYNDAQRFADLLKTQFKFPEEAVTLLTDAPDTPESRRPTYIHLRNAFKTLLAGINDKSEVVIYFSGHGTRAEDHDWLVPLDGVPSDVNATCINYDDFKSQLNTKTPARALLIVDACRNLSGGKDAGSSGFGAGKGLTGPQFAELLSCRPKEESKVGKPEDFTESVFTHFLLQGLRGDPEALDAGVVTFDSLNEYVQGRVSQYVSNKFGESQNPDGRASLGKMVLARGPKGAEGANTAAPALLTPVKEPVLLTSPYKVGDKADYEIEMTSDAGGHPKTMLLNYSSNVKEVRPDGSAVIENTHYSEEVTLDGKKQGEKRAIAGSTLQVWDSHNILRETKDEGTEFGTDKQWLETIALLQIASAILSDRLVKTGDAWEGKFKSPPYPVRDLPYKVTFLGSSRLEDADTWVFKQVISMDVGEGKYQPLEVMIWQSVATGRTVKAEFTVTVQNPDEAPAHSQFRMRQKRSGL